MESNQGHGQDWNGQDEGFSFSPAKTSSVYNNQAACLIWWVLPWRWQGLALGKEVSSFGETAFEWVYGSSLNVTQCWLKKATKMSSTGCQAVLSVRLDMFLKTANLNICCHKNDKATFVHSFVSRYCLLGCYEFTLSQSLTYLYFD